MISRFKNIAIIVAAGFAAANAQQPNSGSSFSELAERGRTSRIVPDTTGVNASSFDGYDSTDSLERPNKKYTLEEVEVIKKNRYEGIANDEYDNIFLEKYDTLFQNVENVSDKETVSELGKALGGDKNEMGLKIAKETEDLAKKEAENKKRLANEHPLDDDFLPENTEDKENEIRLANKAKDEKVEAEKVLEQAKEAVIDQKKNVIGTKITENYNKKKKHKFVVNKLNEAAKELALATNELNLVNESGINVPNYEEVSRHLNTAKENATSSFALATELGYSSLLQHYNNVMAEISKQEKQLEDSIDSATKIQKVYEKFLLKQEFDYKIREATKDFGLANAETIPPDNTTQTFQAQLAHLLSANRHAISAFGFANTLKDNTKQLAAQNLLDEINKKKQDVESAIAETVKAEADAAAKAAAEADAAAKAAAEADAAAKAAAEADAAAKAAADAKAAAEAKAKAEAEAKAAAEAKAKAEAEAKAAADAAANAKYLARSTRSLRASKKKYWFAKKYTTRVTLRLQNKRPTMREKASVRDILKDCNQDFEKQKNSFESAEIQTDTEAVVYALETIKLNAERAKTISTKGNLRDELKSTTALIVKITALILLVQRKHVSLPKTLGSGSLGSFGDLLGKGSDASGKGSTKEISVGSMSSSDSAEKKTLREEIVRIHGELLNNNRQNEARYFEAFKKYANEFGGERVASELKIETDLDHEPRVPPEGFDEELRDDDSYLSLTE